MTPAERAVIEGARALVAAWKTPHGACDELEVTLVEAVAAVEAERAIVTCGARMPSRQRIRCCREPGHPLGDRIGGLSHKSRGGWNW
jgi:hypothetical protein